MLIYIHQSLQPNHEIRRQSLPNLSALQRQRTNADEQRFLEQTPWANPQHPAHTFSHNHAVFSRPQSPAITPVVQRRAVDSSALQESGSTVPDGQSGVASSVAPTPATADYSAGPIRTFRNYTPNHVIDPTPTKKVAPPATYTFLDPGAKRGSGRRIPISVDDDSHDGANQVRMTEQPGPAPTQTVHLNSQAVYPEVKLEERPVHGLYRQHPAVVGAGTVT